MAIKSNAPAIHNTAEADKNNDRFGVMMGGPQVRSWPGIGEFNIGIAEIPRRVLIQLKSFAVGVRPETALGEEALSKANKSVFKGDWSTDPRRIQLKSAQEIANDVAQTFGPEGWVTCKSLTGIEFDRAEALFDSLLPPTTAAKPLVEVLDHLRATKVSLNDPDFQIKTKLHTEILAGAETAFAHLDNHVRALKAEVEIALSSGKGLRKIDNASAEMFAEIHSTLPEELAHTRNIELGEKIGKAVAASQKDKPDSETTALLARLLEQLIKKNEREAKAKPTKAKAA